MNWEEIKEKFEKDFLCRSLRGRVSFEYYEDECSNFDVDDECQQENRELTYSSLSILVDNQVFYTFDSKDYFERRYSMANTRLRAAIRRNISDYLPKRDSFELTYYIADDFIPWLTSSQGVMYADCAVRIMKKYVESSFDEAQEMDNYFVKMLMLLDKRLPADSLSSYAHCADTLEPAWLRAFIKLRVNAEQQSERMAIEQTH